MSNRDKTILVLVNCDQYFKFFMVDTDDRDVPQVMTMIDLWSW